MVLVKHYLKKLKTILQCNLIYYILIVLTLLLVWFSTCFIKYSSKYNMSDNKFECIIKDYYVDGDYLNIELEGLENISGSYYFKTLNEKNAFLKKFKLGDKVIIKGTLNEPTNNTNPNLFNYRRYLYYNRQFYTINIDEIMIMEKNNNWLYKIKNFINQRIDKIDRSKSYIKAFVLGSNKEMPVDVRTIYQNIGISHLFSVSGMHVALLSSILLRLLRIFRLKELGRYFIVILFLWMYMFLTGFSASILRASIFFILLSINKVFKLNIKTLNILILTIAIILLRNPFMVYNIGFLFSSIISIYLVIFSDLINRCKGYISSLLMTSLIALLASIPISMYNFFSFNCLSIIYNLIFVPLVTTIVFPLSLIVFLFPWLDNVLHVFILIMENVASVFNNWNTNLIFIRPSILVCLVYYVVITLVLLGIRKRCIGSMLVFLLMLIIHYNYNLLFRPSYLLMIDVGQGDAILLHSNNKTILIDTGGVTSFKEENDWNVRKNQKTITDNTLIPLFKSLGIKKLDSLFLTHGDYDHMGESINLVESFKVEKAIFNCGEFNELEQELIQVLENKKIPYYSCIKEFNIDDNKLYFLNNKDYGNENDNSNVIYTEFNNYKLLLMGDAGVEVEEDLLERYSLNDIDILKVGHHGSKTSSGEEFIDSIDPKYSIISVGKNNRYGHPNDNVLENLEDSQIYRTDKDGSIMFKIKNNKLEIETCAP